VGLEGLGVVEGGCVREVEVSEDLGGCRCHLGC